MISGPRNSRPTLRGWVNKTTGQLVKQEKITKAQIDEWDAAQKGVIIEVADDPLGLGSPISVTKDDPQLIEPELPDDLGLETLDLTEDEKGVMDNFVSARRKLGEAKLKQMKVSGELDYYKNIVAKMNRKK